MPLPLLLLVLLLALQGAAAQRAEPPGCQARQEFPFSVVQLDGEGRACWGQVRVMTCWGHCRSHEVPDWRFPYKRSHHPVCIHDAVQLRSVTLTECDADVTPGTERYSYLDALSCKCAACDSALTSCEGVQYRGTRAWSAERHRGR